MSTDVLRHDGLDRLLRGIDFIFSKVVSAVVDPLRRLWARTVRNLKTAAAVKGGAKPGAAPQQTDEPRTSLLIRWREVRIRRNAEREFESLMSLDPRMRSEWEAIRDRAEWST